MYTREKKVYKAKVGKLFVESVSLSFGKEVRLSEEGRFAKYLTEKEKNFVLKHFPDAEIKELHISEGDSSW